MADEDPFEITDDQIVELMRAGLVGDAGSAALGEHINRGFEGKRAPTEHERQVARAYCAGVFLARRKENR